MPPGGVDLCGLEFGGERTGWHAGDAFAFNEAPRHFVWNRTDRERIVPVWDVVRQRYRTQKLRVCGDVFATMTVPMPETRLPVLRRLSDGPRRALHRTLAAGVLMVLLTRDRAARA